jgi:hypothetical protein
MAAQAFAAGQIPNAEREQDDFYPTPAEGTRALLAVERFEGAIWEPACGDGAMVRVLEAGGYEVRASDLVDRGFGVAGHDFLMEWRPRAPNIVTNPPFKNSEAFVRKALELTDPRNFAHVGGKVAMLLRLAWLEGRARRALFESSPLARVWVFAGRLSMARGGDAALLGSNGGMMPFAWFVWEHGHVGAPTLGWISPDVEGAIHAEAA